MPLCENLNKMKILHINLTSHSVALSLSYHAITICYQSQRGAPAAAPPCPLPPALSSSLRGTENCPSYRPQPPVPQLTRGGTESCPPTVPTPQPPGALAHLERHRELPPTTPSPRCPSSPGEAVLEGVVIGEPGDHAHGVGHEVASSAHSRPGRLPVRCAIVETVLILHEKQQ